MADEIEFQIDDESKGQDLDNQEIVNDDTDDSGKVDINEEQGTEDVKDIDNLENTDSLDDSGNEGSGYDVKEIYNFLKDNGIAPELEDTSSIQSINDIANIMYKRQEESIQKGIEENLNNVTQPYKDLFNYIQQGGDVKDFVQNYSSNYENFDNRSLKDNISLQEKVLLDYYKNTTQWDDSMIKKHLNKLDESEKEDMSKTALNTLKQYEQTQKQQLFEQQQQQKQQQEKYIEQQVQSYKEKLSTLNQVGDIKLSVADKKDMEHLLFNDVTYNKVMNKFDDYRMNLVILDKLGLLDDPNKITQLMQGDKNKKYNFKSGGQRKTNNNTEIDIELQDRPKVNKTNDGFPNWLF